jgi:hypothetical protein
MENLTRLYVVPEVLGPKVDVPAPGQSGSSRDARYTYYVEANGLLLEFDSVEISQESENIRYFTDGTQKQLKALMVEMTSSTPTNFGDYLYYVREIGDRYAEAFIPQVVKDFVRDLPGGGAQYLYVYAPQHWIPWELIYDGQSFWGDKCIVVRVPVLKYSSDAQSRSVLASASKPLNTVMNIVGDQVVGNLTAADQSRLALDTLLGSAQHSSSNLQSGTWQPMTISNVRQGIDAADIVHFTCHGRRDEDFGYYLELHATGQNPRAYRLHDRVIKGQFPLDDALVFANACTSDVPSLDYGATYIHFGQEFFESGAGAFIGTLAPVPIDRAVRLAAKFYDYLLAGDSVGKALYSAKADMKADQNPFYLFYCLYGNALRCFAPGT